MKIQCEDIENFQSKKLEEKFDDPESAGEKNFKTDNDKIWFTAHGFKQYVRDRVYEYKLRVEEWLLRWSTHL